jgi:hypothetical protein
MLWHKSWLDTRWRFLIGFGVLVLSACGTVFDYPRVARLLPSLAAVRTGAPMARFIQEAIDAERTYRGFVWYQWFHQNLAQTWTLFAVLLGSGGLIATGGGALFTLSLPVSRARIFGVRAATALAELLVLAMVPSLVIPLTSPLVGEHFGLLDVVVQGTFLFVAGSVFFSLATFLSTVFADFWRPLLIACAAAIALAIVPELVPGGSIFAVYRVIDAGAYFRGAGIDHAPWIGLLAGAATSAALLYGAALNYERCDF